MKKKGFRGFCRRVISLIFRNWGLKLISLIMASLLWILVVQMGDPPDDRDMGNVQVKLINTELLDQENKVYQILDHTDIVRVTVSAPTSVFERMRNSDIIAEADVSRLTDINTVPIVFSTSIANVLSIKGSREMVKLDVEDKASKYVNLNSSAVGEVAEGYMVTNITPDQNRIEVSGPKSLVDQVKNAGVELDVTDASSNLTANIEIKLFDAEGNVLEYSNLKKNVNYVRLAVEVLAVKDVPVEVSFTGEPAEGYMATGEETHEPSVVKIAGTSYALSRINSIKIPADRLDITDRTEDLEDTVDIREYLPDNVKLAEASFNGRVPVTVYVEAIAKKTLRIPKNSVSLTNLPEGVVIEEEESDLDYYVLEMQGLGRYITPLRQENISGTADVSAWMQDSDIKVLTPGIYDIPIAFTLDSHITVNRIQTVRVIVSEVED